MNLIKPFSLQVLLSRAFTSTQLISTSTQLILATIQLSATPQCFKNQNIARNWSNSPNLGRKIQSCPFCLKIGTHGIMEVLISNPDLEFRNSNPQIIFWANLSRKSQSWPFCLKIGIHGILEELILHPDLVFQNSDHKIHFWANLDRKIQNWPSENWHT